MWFNIDWYPDNWYKVKDNRHICTVDLLKEALKGLLHQEPRLSEVGMVVSRVEEVGFWKIYFMHCFYFRNVT